MVREMINLVKMYLYKMIRSFGLGIVIFLSALLLVSNALKILLFPKLVYQDFSALEIMIRFFSSGMPCLIFCVFLSKFFLDDEKNGFLKNIIPKLKNRSIIYFSRFIVMVIFVFIMFLINFIESIVVYKFLIGNDFSKSNLDITKIILLFVLYVSFLSFTNMLLIVCRDSIVPILIGVISLTGIIAIPVMLFNELIISITSQTSFDLGDYLVSINIKEINWNIKYLKILPISFIYLFLSTFTSLYFLKQCDIK